MSKSNLILAKLIQEFGALTPRVSKEIVDLIDKKYIIRLDEREEEVTEIPTESVLSSEPPAGTPMTDEEIERHAGYSDQQKFDDEIKDLTDADAAAGYSDEDADNDSHAEDEVNFSDDDRDSSPVEAGQVTNDQL